MALYIGILKTSLIRLIYKNGYKSDYNSYIPIAILQAVEKVLEEVIVKIKINSTSKKG